MKLDFVDEAIHDIIGKDSPVVEGLGLPEASGSDVFFSIEPPVPVAQTERSSTISSRKRKRQEVQLQDDDDIITLKKQLLKAEIYKTKVDAYKSKIEIYKLEIELGLPPSEFTEQIYIEKEKNLDAEENLEKRILNLDCYWISLLYIKFLGISWYNYNKNTN